MSDAAKKEIVTITVDGQQIQVPKGMNLVDAAALAGIDIPHYCYHQNLSIAGNCRMCQVEIGGSPKLGIACNTTAAEGLTVKTHFTSAAVAEAQRATLEFLLINHPLDCTVCDQAGHCKLQDYYYEYDGKGSRFIENKVDKVKAEPLGPDVIYDGERCIMCTRCVRFCDEITETSELGAFNRGDHGVIGVIPGTELDNPLSGTVVDLCPVGALTHRRWRFNTRIWYAGQQDSVCPGCSTGCNVKVAVRDDRIVQVKARNNQEVNKEWMCDEGRYGFERFQPNVRATEPVLLSGESYQGVTWGAALEHATKLQGGGEPAVFLSPFLTLEEVWIALEFAEKTMGATIANGKVAMQLRQRGLDPVSAILVSPDYAPNARAITLLGLNADDGNWRQKIEEGYTNLLSAVSDGKASRILFVGDGAVAEADLSENFRRGLHGAACSVALSARGTGGAQGENSAGVQQFSQLVLPGRTVNEKNGVLVNRDRRLQRLRSLLSAPFGSLSEWMLLARIAGACGKEIISKEIVDDRAVFREMTKRVPAFKNLTLAKLGQHGARLEDLDSAGTGGDQSAHAAA